MPTPRVTLDFITTHDGASSTLLMGETILTPQGISQADLSAPVSGQHLRLRNWWTDANTSANEIYYRPHSSWASSGNPNPQGPWGVPTTDRTIPTPNPANPTEVLVEKRSSFELDLAFDSGTWYSTSTPSPWALNNVGERLLSRHSGGGNVSFCDGSARFLNNSIHPDVFRHLTTPWGRSIVGVDMNTISGAAANPNPSNPSPDNPATGAGDNLIRPYGVLDDNSY